ncbi:hypothetical protein HK102_012114, partial [Quaeritorhiza haematococci]
MLPSQRDKTLSTTFETSSRTSSSRTYSKFRFSTWGRRVSVAFGLGGGGGDRGKDDTMERDGTSNLPPVPAVPKHLQQQPDRGPNAGEHSRASRALSVGEFGWLGQIYNTGTVEGRRTPTPTPDGTNNHHQMQAGSSSSSSVPAPPVPPLPTHPMPSASAMRQSHYNNMMPPSAQAPHAQGPPPVAGPTVTPNGSYNSFENNFISYYQPQPHEISQLSRQS